MGEEYCYLYFHQELIDMSKDLMVVQAGNSRDL